VLPHFADTFFYDPFRGATPPGMKYTYGVALGIGEDYRKAVCGQDGEKNSGVAGHQAVAGHRLFCNS
jgi:hypothetical protein